jgi:hypothetical protein
MRRSRSSWPLRFAAANQRTTTTIAGGQALRSSTEVAAQIRLLTERGQAFSDTWRQDVTTTPDGIVLIYTPKNTGSDPDEPGLPPLFDLSSADDATGALVRSRGDIRDYGGELIVDAAI